MLRDAFSEKILRLGRSLRRSRSAPINLLGDRDIEWTFAASRIPSGPGKALDFGNGGSPLGLLAAMRGFEVIALDLNEVAWFFNHPKLTFVKGDGLNWSPDSRFDLIINSSTVEHVGLAGRYGVTNDEEDADLRLMSRLRGMMSPSGQMLMTVPVGKDAVFSPMCRVYGRERLPRLLEHFEIMEEIYWTKNEENKWVQTQRNSALAYDAWAGSSNPLLVRYGLGCYTLAGD